MKSIPVAIAVLLNPEGKVLLTQRHDPQNLSVHLKWQLPGGGIEKNESAIDACIRETLEEIGLNVAIMPQEPGILTHKYK